MSRQFMMKNLNAHELIIGLLNEGFYILENMRIKKENQPII